MAITSDLTFGHGLDDKLEEIQDTMPSAFQDDLVSMVAALVTLDDMFGLRRDDDYVLVTPGYMMWLLMMFTPVDPELVAAVEAGEGDEEALERLMMNQPFEVDVKSPEDDVFTEEYPEIVRNKRLRFRLMDEKMAEKLDAMCTVRADGNVIYLPKDGKPRNINDM